MKNLVLTLPESIELETIETTRFLAAKLFEIGKLTLGQAAEMSGLTKNSFAEILKDFGVSLINYSPDEVDNDSRKI